MPGELKPCPFNCRNGRAGLYVDLQEISPNRGQWAAYAFCDDCGSRGPLIRSDVQKVALRLAGEAWDARRTGTPEKAPPDHCPGCNCPATPECTMSCSTMSDCGHRLAAAPEVPPEGPSEGAKPGEQWVLGPCGCIGTMGVGWVDEETGRVYRLDPTIDDGCSKGERFGHWGVQPGAPGVRKVARSLPESRVKSDRAKRLGLPCSGCAHSCGPGCTCDCHWEDTNLLPAGEREP